MGKPSPSQINERIMSGESQISTGKYGLTVKKMRFRTENRHRSPLIVEGRGGAAGRVRTHADPCPVWAGRVRVCAGDTVW